MAACILYIKNTLFYPEIVNILTNIAMMIIAKPLAITYLRYNRGHSKSPKSL